MTAYQIVDKSIAKNRPGGLSDGWTRIQQRSKFIFAKIMEEGTYEADSDAEMYLFNDVQYGINGFDSYIYHIYKALKD